MPRLGEDLFNMSDEDFLVANSQVDSNSSLGSSESSDTLKGGGDDPASQNQGGEDDQKAAEVVAGGAGNEPAGGGADNGTSDGTQSDAGAADDSSNESLDVSDDEFDPKAPAGTQSASDGVAGTAKSAADQSAGAGTGAAAVKPADDSKAPKGGDPASEEKPGETSAVPLSEEQLRAFYAQVMKPFKANNKELTIRTPEEAIRLMQMGAGYGKKLNDLQPHLKALRTLEKHGLLDEKRLSFLIDVNQKNPEAIKQLLRDAKIDPLDLNMEEGTGYKAPDYSVSDAETAFSEVLADVRAAKGGVETIRHVNESWDEPSKARLWQTPEILRVIQTQRETGIYDQIVAEMERQKLFGTIAPNTPFLDAYKQAGDSLVKAAGINPAAAQQTQQAPVAVQPKAPVALGTGTAKLKTPVSNDAKARAAASSTNKAAKVVAPVDMLDMSDDDFMKHFGPKF